MTESLVSIRISDTTECFIGMPLNRPRYKPGRSILKFSISERFSFSVFKNKWIIIEFFFLLSELEVNNVYTSMYNISEEEKGHLSSKE